MRCPRCAVDNGRGRRFCSGCGAALGAACDRCGFANEIDARFCGGCGVALGSAAGAGGASSPALESERKYVTVLFADVRGSLELFAQRDPEDAQTLLEPVLERLITAVHRYGGTVNQVLGDGIMSLFGAPVAYEDHALRACSAALAMQEAVDALSVELSRAQRPQVQVRVGMNSGEVVLRAMIGDVHRDYSAVGETTHVASRVEQLTRPGSITLTETTLRLVDAFVDVAPLGATVIKGLPRPLPLYELLGLRTTRPRLRTARPLSPFVGRALEREALAEGLAKACRGQGQFIALVGEPGVGKSRLFMEFTRSALTQPCVVLESGAEAFGPTSPFLPIVEVLRTYFGVERGDDSGAVRAAVERGFAGIGGGLEEHTALFVSLLTAGSEPPALERVAAAERQYRVVHAITDLLLHESRRQPVVLVIEDLHWIDGPTQAFLDTLLDRLREARILLLVSYRPDYDHVWGHRTFRQLRLERLAGPEVEALLDALVGRDASLDDLKHEIERHTDGNPLFVEESVQALVESGVLAGEPGRYRRGITPPLAHVPASVQAVLAARIDRLAAAEKRILQCAAVIGRHIGHDLLLAVADLPLAEVDAALGRLCAAEFLYETRRFPSAQYVFKHALTHEVAYGTLLQDRRKTLHGRLLEILEARMDETDDTGIEALAYHAFRAETWADAAVYLRRAAARAVARSADAEAITHLERAVVALSQVPETDGVLRDAIDARLELRNALMPIADRPRIFRALSEAEAIAKRLGDEQRLGWISGYLSPYLWGLGQYARALETGRQAVATGRAHDDPALEAIGHRYLGHVHYALGDYRIAADLLNRSLGSLHEEVIKRHFGLPFLSSIATEAWLVSALAELGEFDEAIARGREAMGAAERTGHAYSVATAACGLALAYVRRGDVAPAIDAAERCLDLCRAGDFSALLAWATAMLGYAYALGDKPDAALLLLQEGADRMATMQVKVTEAMVASALGEAHLLAGRVAEASTLANRAVETARGRRERACEAWGLRLLGEIAARAGAARADEAASRFQDAATIARELEMRPLHAHCQYGLGRTHAQLGRADESRTELAAAATLFRSLGMTYWARRTEAGVRP